MAEAGCDWDFIEVDIAGTKHGHHWPHEQRGRRVDLASFSPPTFTGKLETSDHAPLDFLFKTTGEELYDVPVAALKPFCSQPRCTVFTETAFRLHVQLVSRRQRHQGHDVRQDVAVSRYANM